MRNKNISKSTLKDLPPDCTDTDGRIEAGGDRWLLDLPLDHLFAFSFAQRDRYLTCPAGPCSLLKAVYLRLRKLRGQSAAMLYPTSEARWRISATCFDSSLFRHLRRDAETAGVEIDMARPEVGELAGWIDTEKADFGAWRLTLLRTGPDLTKGGRLRSARKNAPTPISAGTEMSRK